MHEMKTENVYKDFSSDKKCLILVVIQLNQKTTMIQLGGLKNISFILGRRQ